MAWIAFLLSVGTVASGLALVVAFRPLAAPSG